MSVAEAAINVLCRVYLMKQIVRQYSMDILKQISDVRRLHWLIPQEAREDQVWHFPLIYVGFNILCGLLNLFIVVWNYFVGYWLGGIVIGRRTCNQEVASSAWCSFITTLGKSFTPVCLCHQAV